MEIGKLQFLQTLDLRTDGSMEVLSSVVRLGQSMCLYVHSCIRLPYGIGNMVSLEMLYNMKVGGTNATAKELGNLVELRRLGVWWLGEDESVCNSLLASLDNLRKLCSLSIDHVGDARFDFCWDSWVPCPHLHTFKFTHCTSTLPRWITALLFPILSYLHIQVDKVRPEVDIQILGKLPALRFLRLETTIAQSTPVERFIIGDDAFPFLREGRFCNFLMGPSMFPQGSMPRLESLQFRARASHIADGDLDVYMGHLLSLQEVHISLWSEENCLQVAESS